MWTFAEFKRDIWRIDWAVALATLHFYRRIINGVHIYFVLQVAEWGHWWADC